MIYKEFAPTAFDHKGAFLPGKQEWLVAPVCRTRDSGPFDESNFESCLGILGGEGDKVEVHRFGHWGPGWYEIILVHPDKEAEVEEIEKQLKDYPILDDSDLSERELDSAFESWELWGHREFIGFFDSDTYPNCYDVLEDWDSGDSFQLYCNLAPQPYFEEGGGMCFPYLKEVAQGITPKDWAKIIKGIRRVGT